MKIQCSVRLRPSRYQNVTKFKLLCTFLILKKTIAKRSQRSRDGYAIITENLKANRAQLSLSLYILMTYLIIPHFSMRFNSIQGNKKKQTNKQEEILCLFVQEKKKYADQYKSSLVYIYK